MLFAPAGHAAVREIRPDSKTFCCGPEFSPACYISVSCGCGVWCVGYLLSVYRISICISLTSLRVRGAGHRAGMVVYGAAPTCPAFSMMCSVQFMTSRASSPGHMTKRDGSCIEPCREARFPTGLHGSMQHPPRFGHMMGGHLGQDYLRVTRK